ncbi:MAG: type II/IV secretion system protein [Parcubacteria group bacterium]|nr:type II/IV secretion system protein [Parcubacteria group bacterium]
MDPSSKGKRIPPDILSNRPPLDPVTLEKINRGFEEDETKREAKRLGLPFINLVSFPVDPLAATRITEHESRTTGVLPFFENEVSIRVGLVDPENPKARERIAELERASHKTVERFLISQSSFRRGLDAYRIALTLPHERDTVFVTEEDLKEALTEGGDLQALGDSLETMKLTKTLAHIIAGALIARASDIHLETKAEESIIRFRIDGVLREIRTLSLHLHTQLVNRIKILSNLKLNITREAQDGHFTIATKERQLEVRVSTLPTPSGENVALRLLQEEAARLTLSDLGLREHDFKLLSAALEKPIGMILSTGPTGAGKTTTLYAALNRVNQPGVKIITVEDPIEYRLPGVNQTQVDQEKHYTFATALRSIVRQDPDVLLVGEIRDLETADIATNAALTGHLVLSTLHTNTAAGSIPRFVALGVKTYLLEGALKTIIGQRLVRRICPACKEEYIVPDEEQKKIQAVLARIPDLVHHAIPKKLTRGKGCHVCGNTGYQGRIGIFEIIDVQETIRKLIAKQASEVEIESEAIRGGMYTMVADGILKTFEGVTTVEEVLRVAQ